MLKTSLLLFCCMCVGLSVGIRALQGTVNHKLHYSQKPQLPDLKVKRVIFGEFHCRVHNLQNMYYPSHLRPVQHSSISPSEAVSELNEGCLTSGPDAAELYSTEYSGVFNLRLCNHPQLKCCFALSVLWVSLLLFVLVPVLQPFGERGVLLKVPQPVNKLLI